MQKIALLLPSNIWYSPFLTIYTQLLDKTGVDYDIISWNRDGKDDKIGIQYNGTAIIKGLPVMFSKLLTYYKFISFVKKKIKENQYDKLIVFCPQLAIILSSFLKKNFKSKYIFDYRDLSIEQKPILKRIFKIVLNNSYANVISSPGFKRCLPKGFHYYLSHNFDYEVVKKAITTSSLDTLDGERKIYTVGGIRDFSSNIEVVKGVANINNYSVHFIGRGFASDQIKKYCDEHKIENVFFHGYYKKDEEGDIVKSSSFLNIFYPRIITHDTAISNRFYNSLIYKKPMIVTKNTTQGDYAEKYGVGLAVDCCDNLKENIESYINKYDAEKYSKNCNILLKEFLDDYEEFKNIVLNFATN